MKRIRDIKKKEQTKAKVLPSKRFLKSSPKKCRECQWKSSLRKYSISSFGVRLHGKNRTRHRNLRLMYDLSNIEDQWDNESTSTNSSNCNQ